MVLKRQCAPQPTQQRQPPLNGTRSLELVKSLLRLVVYQIVHARGLFPASSFRRCSLPHLEGLEVQMLLPMDEDAKLLISWMEHGVCDALKKGYLQALRFGISRNGDASEIMEEFELIFKYCGAGECQLDFRRTETEPTISQRHSGVANRIPNQLTDDNTLDTVKQQVAAIIRKLIVTCTTLGPPPEQRCVFMKLVYTDSCPESYQPMHFRDFTPEESDQPGALVSTGMNATLGTFQTGHHGMSLGVSSMLDQFPASQELVSVPGDNVTVAPGICKDSNEQHQHGGTVDYHTLGTPGARRDDNTREQPDIPLLTKQISPAPAATPTERSACASPQASEVTRDTVMDGYVEQVEEFCAGQQGEYQFVTIGRLVQAFPEIPEPALEIAVGVLSERRLLQQGKNSCEFAFHNAEKLHISPKSAVYVAGNASFENTSQAEAQPAEQHGDRVDMPPPGKSTCESGFEESEHDPLASPSLSQENQLAHNQCLPSTQRQHICTESLDLVELLAQQKASQDEKVFSNRNTGLMDEVEGCDKEERVMNDSQATELNSQLPPLQSIVGNISNQSSPKKRANTPVMEVPVAQPKRARTRAASQPQPQMHHEIHFEDTQDKEDNSMNKGLRRSRRKRRPTAAAISASGRLEEGSRYMEADRAKPQDKPLKPMRGRGRPRKTRSEETPA